MKSRQIVVVGSTNMDMVVKTTHIPKPGETVLGGSFLMNPGGKGANQAVAVARLGGNAVFVSKMGNDIFGKQSFQLFEEEGIITEFILSDDELPSGVALITVDDAGENSIVVAPGANAYLLPGDIEVALKTIVNADIVLMQLEIPMETVRFLSEFANANGVRVLLNPAPARALSPELLSKIHIITPNRTEASMIADMEINTIEDAQAAALIIHGKGVKNVVITMGSMGAVVLEEGVFHIVPAQKVTPLDTTAAGDVFNGALAVSLSEEKSLLDSVKFACEAAAISVTRMGAQSSIPYRNELIVSKLVTD